jgi:hypothetical protein
MLHQAAAAAGLSREAYRTVLRNVAGVVTSTDPQFTREHLIAVMAFFEGECKGRLAGFTAGYWRAENAKSDPRDSLRFACRREAKAVGFTPEDLDGFLASRHCSSGRFSRVDDAPAYWLSRCLDGLKAMRERGVRIEGWGVEVKAEAEAGSDVPF